MLPSDAWDTISIKRLRELANHYSDYLPAGIEELDKQRYESLPVAFATRDPTPQLTLKELSLLMEWKLKRGKFRPNLMKLVRENDDQFVRDVTARAFPKYISATTSGWEDPRPVLQELIKLRGVGPATASLLLSVYDDINYPFFSDELFRYVNLNTGLAQGQDHGWNRKIAYSQTEYVDLYRKVQEMQARLRRGTDQEEIITAALIEKAAYVLGKQHTLAGTPAEIPQPKARSNEQKRKAGRETQTTETEDGQRAAQKGEPDRKKTKKVISKPDVKQAPTQSSSGGAVRSTRTRRHS